VRCAVTLFFALALSGCGIVLGRDEPTDDQLAQFCGVSVGEFKKASAELKMAKPYDGREVGQCTLIKDDTGKVVTASIRQPPKAND